MHPVRLPPSLSPLTQPNFRLLWVGQGISAVGDALVPVALAFATLTVARSASALGLVLATATLARVISLPIGGVWADRLPRQRVMLASDIIRGLVQATVAALLLTHTARLWHLVLASAVFSFAGGFFQPASTALTPQTVVPEKLQQANALMGLSRSATWVIGPAISGVLVATVGPAWSFGIDAATFAVSTLSLAVMTVPPLTGIARKNFWTELGDGIRAVAGRRWYLLNLGAHAMWNFAFAAFMVAGPIVARDHLGGARAWGFIAASMGVGSIVGGLIALRVMPRRPLIIGNLALTLTALQLLATAVPEPTVVIMAACVVGEAGFMFLSEIWFSTIPQLLPADLLARATSFDWLVSIISMPLGFAITGPVADHIGIRTTLVAAAFIMVVPCILIVLVPGVRQVKRTPEGRIVLEAAV
jgi:MFS family permease